MFNPTRGPVRGLLLLVLLQLSFSATAEESTRAIEEIVVTAEKRESTVSDTSFSISAFDGQFLEDFGIRNQEDLANYIPATTIQPYDMAVRGVGRTFRALGGDPGISTYLNGVYSEDFGIASTEGGLYDLERIEVLRGPQGTLYGRNAVGGAVNFINKKPTDEFEGEIKTIFGTDGIKDFYGMVSGPIIEGLLNARATGVKRSRDGYYEARIDQRGDFYSAVGESRYADPVDYSPLGNAVLAAVFPTRPSLFSAKAEYNSLGPDTDLDGDGDADRLTTNLEGDASVLEGSALNGDSYADAGLWYGDNESAGCSRIPSGPTTCGSFLEYATQNDT